MYVSCLSSYIVDVCYLRKQDFNYIYVCTFSLRFVADQRYIIRHTSFHLSSLVIYTNVFWITVNFQMHTFQINCYQLKRIWFFAEKS